MKVTKIAAALSLSLVALTSSYAGGVPAKPGEPTYAQQTAMCAVTMEDAYTYERQMANGNPQLYKTLGVKFRDFTKDEVKSGRSTQAEVDEAYDMMRVLTEYQKYGKDPAHRMKIVMKLQESKKDCYKEAQRLMFIQ